MLWVLKYRTWHSPSTSVSRSSCPSVPHRRPPDELGVLPSAVTCGRSPESICWVAGRECQNATLLQALQLPIQQGHRVTHCSSPRLKAGSLQAGLPSSLKPPSYSKGCRNTPQGSNPSPGWVWSHFPTACLYDQVAQEGVAQGLWTDEWLEKDTQSSQ